MNTNKASSSDEDRENNIVLTPASTTVSDEGELISGSSSPDNDGCNNDIRSNDNDLNDTNNDPIPHNDNGEDNDNDGDDDNEVDDDDDDKSGRFDWKATAFGRSQGLLTQVGSLSKELTELKAMIARGAPPGSSVSEEQAEVRVPPPPYTPTAHACALHPYHVLPQMNKN